VTNNVAVCVPWLENEFVQVDELPVQAPDQEYVYVPVPPDTLQINETVWFTLTGFGEA
jgi:hypothetical protein